jgi:hypothetical protein
MEDTLFRLANAFVLPFWGLMIFAPHWSWSVSILRGWWMLAILCGYYVLGLVWATQAPGPPVFESLMNPTLPAIHDLLSRTEVTAPAWSHYLAFDLFIGRWMFLRERRRGYWLSPILLATLMLGPVGLLAYLFWRGATIEPADRDDFSTT